MAAISGLLFLSLELSDALLLFLSEKALFDETVGAFGQSASLMPALSKISIQPRNLLHAAALAAMNYIACNKPMEMVAHGFSCKACREIPQLERRAAEIMTSP
jgi:hypothetical protein